MDEPIGPSVPGQFVMLTIPGDDNQPPKDQIPLSISYPSPLQFAVKVVGDGTRALSQRRVGEDVLVRGPLGRGYPIEEFNSNCPVYLIGGGIGLSPLRYLAYRLKERGFDITTFMGARSSDRLLFSEDFEKCGRVYTCTDDGSGGMRGWLPELLESHSSDLDRSAIVAVCGNERMMVQVLTVIQEFFDPKNVYLALERDMKCGMGICGSCDFGGYRLCVDGPVVSYQQILSNPGMSTDFGRFGRDTTGKKTWI
ncbi:MAG: hypothetical protein QXY45_01395 [Candidatus Aenigmatarchaeota archaeon]